MLDIHFIRENRDIIIAAIQKKKVNLNLQELLDIDEERRKLTVIVDTARAEQNTVSEKIVQVTGSEKEQMIMEMRRLKEELQASEEKLKSVLEAWRALMLQVPNIPDMSVPDGDSDADNKEIKAWGEKPQFTFIPKSHIDLMTDLDMVDFERGAKVHGFRGYFLKNDGARLSFAVWNYALDFFAKKGFELMITPTIVKKQHLYGTGHLPNDVEDIYRTQDDDYLSGTAEIPVMGFHSDEILPKEELPKKYLAFSPCFRREIGSYGKDTKGLIRVHEFYKVEQVILCEASHETSVALHEELTRNSESFVESLGLAYRVVINCAGDLGLGQVKKYDIEVWVPSEEKYRETHSSSYFHDFQTRRFNIKYRDESGKMRYTHSLNNTAAATPRLLAALVENYQQEDGSINIPEVLRSYMGGREKIVRRT